MPPRIINYCVDAHYRYTFDGNSCENIFQYAYNDGANPTVAQLQALALNLQANVLPVLRTCMPAACVFRELFIRDMHAASGRAQYTLDLGGVTGTRGANPTPGNVAANLISRTGLTGRNNHGAKRIGPFTENDSDMNELLAGIITALLNLGLQWLVTRTVSGLIWQPAVASAQLHTRRAIVSVLLNNNFVDSQKTRLTGHGE